MTGFFLKKNKYKNNEQITYFCYLNSITRMKKFSIIHYIVLILITLSILIQLVYYLHTGHYNSPIIQFEFAENKKDVSELFIENDKTLTDVIQGVEDQNIVDFLYMLSYSSLLILVFLKIKRHERVLLNQTGILISFLALFFDVCENIVLFRISRALGHQMEYESFLGQLMLFTNLKWICLSLVFFILSFHYYKNGALGKIFSILSLFPLFMAFPSFFSEHKDFDIYYAYSVMLAFIILIIRIFVSKFAKNSIVFYKDKHFKNRI
jgi:hypothetical protein